MAGDGHDEVGAAGPGPRSTRERWLAGPINRVSPRLCRGGSQCLTVPGVVRQQSVGVTVTVTPDGTRTRNTNHGGCTRRDAQSNEDHALVSFRGLTNAEAQYVANQGTQGLGEVTVHIGGETLGIEQHLVGAETHIPDDYAVEET